MTVRDEETERFGEAAERLAAVASMLLGWLPTEFWAATPAELQTVLRGTATGAASLDANALAELRQRFPDN